MAIAQELRAAVAGVTGLDALARGLPREARVGGLVFYPVLGAVLGGLAAAVAHVVAPAGVIPSALAALGVLAAGSGGRTLRDLAARGLPVVLLVLLAKLWAVARLPDDARLIALPLAAMLGRWAMVVQCYGGSAASAAGEAGQLVGRARLREFGWASALAFGLTLAALDAVGLLVLLAATLITVAIRVLAYRRPGGVGAPLLGVSAELAETVALLVLAALARG